ncbi:MAG: aldo/keto reductase [Chloroflexi bacterium]|nr:aldo/keto reductase [Chloroflexota bacterium]
MEYRPLGSTGLQVSIAGLGTGGPAQLGQKAGLSAQESQRLVRVALDLGINIFDSSPAYGKSEELLGAGLQGVPRDRFIVATKFQPHEGNALKQDPQALMAQLEESLRRLRLETIDVLQYHGVAPEEYRTVIDRFHPVALRAQEQGKVRFLGITETVANDPQHEMLNVALAEGIHDTCMVHYGILNQQAEHKVFPLARQHNVGIFVMAPVRTSLRTPDEAVRRMNEFIDKGWLDIPRPSINDPLGLGRIGKATTDVTRIAYLFAAVPQEVSTVLIGTGNIDHLRKNVRDISGPKLSPEEIAFLRQTYGHLAWDA